MIRDARGATAVEFAMLLPGFLVFVLGIGNCGMMLWTQLGIQHGVVEAARCATINPSSCPDVPAYASQQAYDLNIPKTAFTLSSTACGNQVTANYQFPFTTLMFPPMNVTLTALSCYPT